MGIKAKKIEDRECFERLASPKESLMWFNFSRRIFNFLYATYIRLLASVK